MKTKPLALLTVASIACATHPASARETEKPAKTGSTPVIDPAHFSAEVTHEYFTLTPRKKMVYEANTEDGVERVESYVTTQTRTIMGVPCTVVRKRVWLDDALTEDTLDSFAQDDGGNVWSFGETSKEMSGGKVVREDSWEAGVGSAQPGIMMLAHPTVGETMQPESSPGTTQDRAEVIGVDETITVPFGELSGCLRTRENVPGEPNQSKHRCYCPEVGGVALEADPTGGEALRLVSVESDADPTPDGAVVQPAKPARKITEEQAKAIALKKVPGKVTEVSIERKFGKLAYVIEVQVEDGPETDVIIDMETGEVLGTEI